MSPQYTTVNLMYNLKVECVIKSSGRHSETTGTNELVNSLYSQTLSSVTHKGSSQQNSNARDDDDLTYWSPSCAVVLAYHR